MEQIEQLIDDYKRRLKTVMTEIRKGGNDLTINRLSTKASCYRTFIVELERAKESLNKKLVNDLIMEKFIFKNIVYKGVEISIMAYTYTEAMEILLIITRDIDNYRLQE